ncbi:MAG: sigma 54-interacting transcriptional regulator [Planctomycetes bacterium]|nr:sigma 54-interacting transcriptional regulator [Planctomycetota bacterium]
MPRFAIHERGSIRHVELGDRTVRIGADLGCDLTLLGDGVEQEHAVVERGKTGWHVRTAGGARMLVNGMDLPDRRLRDGDRLEIGDAVLVFENPRPPERDMAAASAGAASRTPAPARATVVRAEDLDRLRSTLRALAAEPDFRKLLRTIVDQVVSLTKAERGFLVLRQGERDYEMVAARSLDGEDVQRPAVKISRAVAEEVAKTGRPLLTTNAQADARLRESKSVEGMRLRSVLCLPLTGRGGFLGFLYLDHRFEEAAFRDTDLPLLEAFADQAAVALENARLVGELRERTGELARSKARVEELNQRLEERVQAQQQELHEVRSLLQSRSEAPLRHEYKAIVGRSGAMMDVLRLLDHVVETAVPVLVLGESGTGKELVARAVHDLSPRSGKKFVSENCAAIPESLLESALFGHVRGAFTGADRDASGLFEQADGGTLFLDEIGELPLSMQVKLLRVLESGEMRRVGGKDVTKVDVRIVCATNRDLGAMVEDGRFREDLYYRINVFAVRLPPLRERPEDVPALVAHFLADAAASSLPNAPAKTVTPEAMDVLAGYPWPGNVRQLRNEIQRACALSDGVIAPSVLSDEVRRRSVPVSPAGTTSGRALKDVVQEAVGVVERRAVLEALIEARWKKTLAAELLQVSRPTLDAKIKRHKIRRAGGEIEE